MAYVYFRLPAMPGADFDDEPKSFLGELVLWRRKK
jgi:hypothetical protein